MFKSAIHYLLINTILKGKNMSIERFHTNVRMSQIVVHNDTVYLAGQVASNVPGASVKEQTKAILEQIDSLLAEVGTDKSKVLSATIWLCSMDDFADMNAVWNKWVVPGHKPARACGESQLARDTLLVEVIATAAK